MNAPEKMNTLRAEIGQYLDRVGEATAKDVADAVLHEKLTVVRALNEMRNDTEVEREKKRGNEYVYWLVADAKVPVSKAEAKPAAKANTDDRTPEAPSISAEQREEFTLLSVIADIRAAIGDKEGRIMLGELAQHIKTISDQRHAALDVVKVWEHNMRQAISADEPITAAAAIRTLRIERDDLSARLDDVQQRWQGDVDLLTGKNRVLHEELAAARDENVALSALGDGTPGFVREHQAQQIGNLTTELAAARTAANHAINEADRLRTELAAARQACEALQEQDNTEPVHAAGYIVRAAKRKPRTIMDQGKAREAALSAIRAGAQRAEVFALLPVGVARKGVEWSETK